MNKEQKSNGPIIAVGTGLVLAVALFTGIAAYKVVEHINADADEAYAAAVTEASMRRLAESQAQQASDLRNIESIPVEVTLRINVVDDRIGASDSIQVDVSEGYTVGDMICINGEWYIISKPAEGGSVQPGSGTEGTEPTTTPGSDGNEGTETPTPTENPTPTETPTEPTNPPSSGEGSTGTTDGDSQIPYIGADYVTIDADGNMVYIVERGDTLTKISRLTGYSIQELAEYNHIENVNLIYTGQAIRIPASQEAIDYVRARQQGSNQ